jgi:plastocyanin
MDPPSKEAQLHPIRREHTDQRAHQRRQTALILRVHLGQDQGPTKERPKESWGHLAEIGGRSIAGSADLTLAPFEPSFHVLTPGDRLEAVWGVIHSVTALNSWIKHAWAHKKQLGLHSSMPHVTTLLVPW